MDRFIPKQISRTNFVLFNNEPKFDTTNKATHGNRNLEDALESDQMTNSQFQALEIKRDMLSEIFCNYETKFGENLADETHKKKEILHFAKDHKKMHKQTSKERQIKKSLMECPIPNFDPELFLNSGARKPLITSKSVKILDAPGLEDNFYYKSIDFTRDNNLVVSLGNTLYQFEYQQNQTDELYQASIDEEICSVACHPEIDVVSMAITSGEIILLDQETQQTMRKLHDSADGPRAVATIFHEHIFGHGNKKGEVYLYDLRDNQREFALFDSHSQEVCSIQFSCFNNNIFASGGNDNQVVIYDLRKMKPLKTLNFHQAAIKALRFSKTNQREMFTGGGSGDQRLCRWDVNKTELKKQINLGSQICSLEMSSKGLVVSTHGWPNNQVEVRDSHSFKLLACFKGHTQRVLDVAIDKKEEIVVTSSGDQSVRFWSIKGLGSESDEKDREFRLVNQIMLR